MVHPSETKILQVAASFGSDRVIFRSLQVIDQGKEPVHNSLDDFHKAVRRARTLRLENNPLRLQLSREFLEQHQMIYLFQPENMWLNAAGKPIRSQYLIPISEGERNRREKEKDKLPVVAIGLKDDDQPYAMSNDGDGSKVSCQVEVLIPEKKKVSVKLRSFLRLAGQKEFYLTTAATHAISFRIGEEDPPILSVVFYGDKTRPIDIAVNPRVLPRG